MRTSDIETGAAGADPKELRRLIDRLVDDELSPSERRALVARLDHSPELWRVCAVAFIENQAFAGDFPAIRRAAEQPSPAPALSTQAAATPTFAVKIDAPLAAPSDAANVAQVTPADPRETPAHGAVQTPRPAMFTASGWSAVLAGVLLSFTVGVTTGPWAQQWLLGGNATAPNSSDARNATAENAATSPISVYDLTLASDGAQSNKVSLPVIEGAGLDEQALRAMPSPLTPDLRRRMAILGENVSERRQLMPVVTPEGRAVLVPYDEVQIRPRSRPQQ